MASPPPDPALIRRARGIEGARVQSVPSLFFEHVILNTTRAPLDDPSVRRALAFAIDRRQIVNVLLDGSVPVLQSVLRPVAAGLPARLRGLCPRPRSRGAAAQRRRLDARGPTASSPRTATSCGSRWSTTAATSCAPPPRASWPSRPAPPASSSCPVRCSPDRIFGSDLVQGDFTAADGGLRRRGRSQRHRAAGERSDPHGGERLLGPERVPVERHRGRQPDASLGSPGGRRRPRARRSRGCSASSPSRCR